ncbi:GIY-YIG nuclease family protein [bacterium]|nr:GIY-YIG nuclease family protein [bacterium]MBU1917373.1 GIY-YIG nuclease family protein [bacterium]
MYYTYILLSHKDNKFYIGNTNNLKRRFKEHQNGLVRSTKCRLPVELVFYEAYLNKYDSIKREKYFKSTKGKYSLKNMLKNYLLEKGLKI